MSWSSISGRADAGHLTETKRNVFPAPSTIPSRIGGGVSFLLGPVVDLRRRLLGDLDLDLIRVLRVISD
jgi:hypothetical protein